MLCRYTKKGVFNETVEKYLYKCMNINYPSKVKTLYENMSCVIRINRLHTEKSDTELGAK